MKVVVNGENSLDNFLAAASVAYLTAGSWPDELSERRSGQLVFVIERYSRRPLWATARQKLEKLVHVRR